MQNAFDPYAPLPRRLRHVPYAAALFAMAALGALFGSDPGQDASNVAIVSALP